MPPQSMLLKEINVTTATLDITSWLTSGCPIRFFAVRYRLWGDMDWHLVNNNIPSNIVSSPVWILSPFGSLIVLFCIGLVQLSFCLVLC